MLSRTEFEQAVSAFLVELNHRCLNVSENELRAMPSLAAKIDECVAELRDHANDPALSLFYAFAYLDFYCHANWEGMISEIYESYKKSSPVPNSDIPDDSN